MILTEQQIREEILRLNAEARKEQAHEGDLAKWLEKSRDRLRSLTAQFDAMRTMLRELHGKDVGATGRFPFALESGEIQF